jgi:hypothetical protein
MLIIFATCNPEHSTMRLRDIVFSITFGLILGTLIAAGI